MALSGNFSVQAASWTRVLKTGCFLSGRDTSLRSFSESSVSGGPPDTRGKKGPPAAGCSAQWNSGGRSGTGAGVGAAAPGPTPGSDCPAPLELSGPC